MPVFDRNVSGLCEMGMIVMEGLGLDVDRWTDGWRDGWVEAWMGGGMDGWRDGWVEAWMGGGMHGGGMVGWV